MSRNKIWGLGEDEDPDHFLSYPEPVCCFSYASFWLGAEGWVIQTRSGWLLKLTMLGSSDSTCCTLAIPAHRDERIKRSTSSTSVG